MTYRELQRIPFPELKKKLPIVVTVNGDKMLFIESPT